MLRFLLAFQDARLSNETSLLWMDVIAGARHEKLRVNMLLTTHIINEIAVVGLSDGCQKGERPPTQPPFALGTRERAKPNLVRSDSRKISYDRPFLFRRDSPL
jgi:hypothetical protein